MATLNTRYVDPDAAAGGNGTQQILTGSNCAYQSLNAWEAARQADISTATGSDSIERAICSSNLDAGSGTADTTVLTIDGWTTDATGYIDIKANSSHGGKWNDNIYRLVVEDDDCIILQEDYINMVGLQIQVSVTPASTSYWSGIYCNVGEGVHNIDKCIVRCVNTDDGNYDVRGIDYYGTTSVIVVNVLNTLVYGFRSSPTNDNGSGFNLNHSNGTMNIYNCTVGDCYDGIYRATGEVNVWNTYVGGCSTEYTGTITRTTCAHSSSTSYSGSTASVAYSTANFTNVTSGSEDLRLTSGSALRKVGYADPGNGLYSDGIQGNARPTVYEDDFNRADGVLTTPWSLAGGFSAGDLGTILSNQVTTDGSTSGSYRTSGIDPNMWSEFDVLHAGGGGPAVRQRTATQRDYYTLYNDEIYRTVNGSNTLIGTLSATPVGKKIRIEATGVGATVNIKVYMDGVLDVDYDDTDATRLTSGEVGLYANTATTGILDNFRGGEMWDIGADQYLAVTSVERTPGAGALVLTGYAAEIAGIDYPITVPTMLRIT